MGWDVELRVSLVVSAAVLLLPSKSEYYRHQGASERAGLDWTGNDKYPFIHQFI